MQMLLHWRQLLRGWYKIKITLHTNMTSSMNLFTLKNNKMPISFWREGCLPLWISAVHQPVRGTYRFENMGNAKHPPRDQSVFWEFCSYRLSVKLINFPVGFSIFSWRLWSSVIPSEEIIISPSNHSMPCVAKREGHWVEPTEHWQEQGWYYVFGHQTLLARAQAS